MEYELTLERRRYIEAKGFTILRACPGSGKTTSIAYKLGKIIENSANRVICLSFTNNAVSELVATYKSFYGSYIPFPHVVSTIDSFFSRYIVLPFWYLIPGLLQRPIIMDDTKNSPIYERHYLDKKGKWSSCFYKKLTKEQYVYINTHNKNEFSIIAPDTYCYGSQFIDKPEEKEVAAYIVKRRLDLGILTSSDIEYYSKCILSQYPDITKALSKRFNYLIMDEAQDMSKMQYDIIQMLIDGGLSNVELVGDLRQSIYAWRNARPELFRDLLNNNKWTLLPFIHNRRSIQTIIDQYNKIKEPQDPDIKSHNVHSLGIPIFVYHYEEDKEQETIQQFIEECDRNNLFKRKVICRGSDQLKKLSGNEDTVSCWKSKIPSLILKAHDDFLRGNFAESIKTLKYVYSLIYDQFRISVDAYSNNNEFASTFSSLEEKPLNVSNLILFLRNLPSTSLTIEKWQENTERLIEKFFDFESGSVDFELKLKMPGYKMKEIRNTPVCDFFQVKRNPNTSEISTVHKVKGLTYDACLVFLRQKQTSNLSLELFSEAKELKEIHRLLYVACSRPRQLLAFAVPKSEPKAKIDMFINPGYRYIEIS